MAIDFKNAPKSVGAKSALQSIRNNALKMQKERQAEEERKQQLFAASEQRRADNTVAWNAARQAEKEAARQAEIQRRDTIADRVSAARDRRDQERGGADLSPYQRTQRNIQTYYNDALALSANTSSTKNKKSYGILDNFFNDEPELKPVSAEDREFFAKKFGFFNPSTEGLNDVRVAKYYYDKAKADDATKEDKERWRDIRNYINNKHKTETAEKLVSAATPTSEVYTGYVAPRDTKGSKIDEKLGIAVMSGLSEGVSAPVEAHATVFNAIKSETRIVENAFSLANQMQMQNADKAEKLALSAVDSIARMVPSQIVGYYAGPVAAASIMGLGSAQSAFEDAIKDGATQGKALVYGGLVGAAEGTLSYFLGGIPGIKRGSTGPFKTLASKGLEGVAKQTVNKVAPKLVSSLDNVLAKVIKSPVIRKALESYVSNIGSEAFEETVQDVFDNALQKWLLGNEDTKLVSMETLESGLLGGIIAAVMGVPNVSVELSSANTDAAITAAEEAATVSNTETVSTPETVEQTTARPNTEEIREKVKNTVKPKSKAENAVIQAYTTGKISSRQVDEVRHSPEARSLFSLLFGGDIASDASPAEFRTAIRSAATEQSEAAQTDAVRKAAADYEAGLISEDDFINTPGALDYLEQRFTSVQERIKVARESGNEQKAVELQTAAEKSKLFSFGMAYFGGFGGMHKVGFTPKMNADLPVAAKPAEQPDTMPQANETRQTNTTTSKTETVPTEPVNAEKRSADGGKTNGEQEFHGPEGTAKLAESFYNNGMIDEDSKAAIEDLYTNTDKLVYEPNSNEQNVENATAKYETVTKGVGINGAVNAVEDLVNKASANAAKLTPDDVAFMVLSAKKAAAEGNTQAFVDIVAQASLLATEVGQTLQAFSMVSKLSANGRLAVAQRAASKRNKAAKKAFDSKTQKEQNEAIHKAEKKAAEANKLSKDIIDTLVTDENLLKSEENAKSKAVGEKALDTIIGQYNELREKVNELKALEKELGKMSEAERVEKYRQLYKDIMNLRAYKVLFDEFASRKVKAKAKAEVLIEQEINKLRGRVELSAETQNRLAEANTPEEIRLAYMAAFQEIGRQTPMTFFDWVDSIRMAAMLSSPKTHVTNFKSNSLQLMLFYLARQESAIAQSVLIRDRSKRTASVITGASAKDRQLLKFAWQNFKEIKTEAQTGSKIQSPGSLIRSGKTTGSRVGDFFLKDFVGTPLEQSDLLFIRSNYVMSLAAYMKAQRIDPNTASFEDIRRAQEYAIKEAQEATYRESNDVAKFLTAQEQKLKKTAENSEEKLSRRIAAGTGYIVAESIMPFKSTPANILKQGALNYTPAGIVKGISKTIKAKGFTGDALTDMCKSMTGTAIMGLGAYLAALGLLHLGGGEDKDKYLQSLGMNNYSFDLGDKNIGLAWTGTIATPLFLGGSLYEALKDDFEFSDILNVAADIATPILSNSFLSGVDDYVNSISYNGWQSVWSYPVTNFFAQFSPGVLNAVNKIFIDPKRRSTATIKTDGGAESNFRYMLNRIASRTPGASFMLEEYVDCWGRTTDTGTWYKRVWDNVFDVANVQDITATDVDKEIIRLYAYEVDGKPVMREDVIPDISNVKTVTAKNKDGESYTKELSAEEMHDYKVVRGQTAYDTVDSIIKNKKYMKLDDDVKAEAIAMAYTYASAEAKMSVAECNVPTWIIKARGGFGGLSIDEVIICRAVISATEASSKEDVTSELKKAGLGAIADDYYTYYKGSSKEVKAAYERYLKNNSLNKYAEKE